jgi:hypothetical protein
MNEGTSADINTIEASPVMDYCGPDASKTESKDDNTHEATSVTNSASTRASKPSVTPNVHQRKSLKALSSPRKTSSFRHAARLNRLAKLTCRAAEEAVQSARSEAAVDKKILKKHRILMARQKKHYEDQIRVLKKTLESSGKSHVQESKASGCNSGESRKHGNQVETVSSLKNKLQEERKLHAKQMQALEDLHMGEFKEMELEHNQFLEKLVGSYLEEIKSLKEEIRVLRPVASSQSDDIPGQPFWGESPKNYASATFAATPATTSGPSLGPGAIMGSRNGDFFPVQYIRIPEICRGNTSEEAMDVRNN